jgi:hypothetical protein
MDDHPYARCYNFVIDHDQLKELLSHPPILPPDWWMIDLNTLSDDDPLLRTICLVLRAMAYGLLPAQPPSDMP